MEKKKEFTYRGMTIEELKKLEVREFAKHTPSREKKYILRNFQQIEDFLNRSKIKIEKGKKIKTHLRDLIIVPEMVGMQISIYNGHLFNPVIITGEMLGHRLGEFSLTRAKIKHGSAGVGATKGSKHQSKK
jgi:small subunit ribosomal protein S19